ncbi:hypothetical protein FACS1894111_00760 [Clostridia bacterium]|nr:hypothetical protein FACS1894111_00760 [Clostridia bacterium]
MYKSMLADHLEYTLIRSKRKTLALHVGGGEIQVRAPLRLSKKEIDRFVTEHKQWIMDKLALEKEQQAKKKGFILDYNTKLLWRGVRQPIISEDPAGGRIWRDEHGFHFPGGWDGDMLKHNVIKLYKICARNYFLERVLYFSKIMEVSPTAVKVNSAKTRWGSCSAKKSLNFSWRLCMAEDEVIDSVIVHELAHLQEMNHSKNFYDVVYAILPDYDARNAKLKSLSKQLRFEDWEM